MKGVTTIQLRKSVVEELKSIKKYHRETYDEVISELIKVLIKKVSMMSLFIKYSK